MSQGLITWRISARLTRLKRKRDYMGNVNKSLRNNFFIQMRSY